MERVIRKLYEGIRDKDPAAIRECYHPEATFDDPVFDLQGASVPAMWHMLCEGGKDMEVSYHSVRFDGRDTGAGQWEASYTFSLTGRRVHNRMRSTFRFKEGRIVAQKDRFDFWRWSRQALGLPGLLLGWTPFLRGRIRKRARGNLDKFLASHPEYR